MKWIFHRLPPGLFVTAFILSFPPSGAWGEDLGIQPKDYHRLQGRWMSGEQKGNEFKYYLYWREEPHLETERIRFDIPLVSISHRRCRKPYIIADVIGEVSAIEPDGSARLNQSMYNMTLSDDRLFAEGLDYWIVLKKNGDLEITPIDHHDELLMEGRLTLKKVSDTVDSLLNRDARYLDPTYLKEQREYSDRTFEKIRKISWWEHARLGLLVHWGLYSKAPGTWDGAPGMWGHPRRFHEGIGMSFEDYKGLAAGFDGSKFDAEAWVSTAKQAGVKYLIFTARHNDGFSMFDTKADDFDIVDRAPFGRDPLKELVEAARKKHLRVGFHYSHWEDWNAELRNETERFEAYWKAKVIPQVTELLTNYGPIDIMCFDAYGHFDNTLMTKTQTRELLLLIRKLQTKCQLNWSVGAHPADYFTFTDRVNKRKQAPHRSWEALLPLKPTGPDSDWVSSTHLIQNIVHGGGAGGSITKVTKNQ
ncbi:MAG: alpha-L-fucosidase [Verrucomicrobiota bacterium]